MSDSRLDLVVDFRLIICFSFFQLSIKYNRSLENVAAIAWAYFRLDAASYIIFKTAWNFAKILGWDFSSLEVGGFLTTYSKIFTS